MKIKNKRRTIEIYFILYLAALLFLLPDGSYETKKGKGTGIQIYQPEFVVIPEKTTLICKVALDSTGPKIISIDSVNTIFYTGDVEDVNFEFRVEDQYLQNSLTLSTSKNSMTKYFRFDDQPERHAAFFRWSPPLQENFSRTYNVKVIATARLRNIDDTSQDNLKQKLVKHSAQFNLLVIYLNAPGGNPLFAQNYFRPFFQDTSYQFTSQFQNYIPQYPTGDVKGINTYSDVKQMANRRWTNSVTFTNINLKTELLRFELHPKTKLENGGSAEVVEIRQNDVLLQGVTPSYGKMSVTLEVFRKDNNSGKVSFTVSPNPVEQPELEKNMYPEISYKIDPKLPDIGKEVKAIITDGKTIRAQSKGETFSWTPQSFDVNKEFFFDRYLENQLMERTPIHILPYSIPQIVDMKIISSNEIEIITKAYGIFNKSRNEVDTLNVEGNAKYRDLRGQITEQQEKYYPVIVQYFRITPVDKSKPFSFKIEAVDRIGNKSLPKIFR